jgi:thiosulfate/3-mercaptopyruvate sulfurtransferase
MPSPLISAAELHDALAGPQPPTVLDVRWQLATGAQPDEYERGHIPGAVFVDLSRDLAGPAGSRGRHPLPTTEQFQSAMRAAGVADDRPVVVYDDANGLPAARTWWLLRYFGHPAPALLDGGLKAWTRAGHPLRPGPAGPAGTAADAPPNPQPAGDFTARPDAMPVLDAAGAAELAQTGVLLDARAPERFRGETEPLDPVAGHIPGARNRPMAADLDDAGRFLPAPALSDAFADLRDQPVGAYCGSGITAAHTVLALELAGIPAALYPGSWSEWVTDPSRPVATGAGDDR